MSIMDLICTIHYPVMLLSCCATSVTSRHHKMAIYTNSFSHQFSLTCNIVFLIFSLITCQK